MSTGFDETLLDPTGTAYKNRYGSISDEGNDNTPSYEDTDQISVNAYKGGNDPFRFVKMPDQFYMNGPTANAWDRGDVARQQLNAGAELWASPQQRQTINYFGNLLNGYGHTNSAGTLWAIAQQRLDPNSEPVRRVLELDARAQNAVYQSVRPVPAGSTAANEAMLDDPTAEDGYTSVFDRLWPDDIWKAPQALARNSFAAASMPLEGLQGGLRTAGGALAEGDFGKALVGLGSIAPPIALLGNAIYGDENFQNAWEQTEFGQTLLTATSGAGVNAFFGQQAGIDAEAATQMLSSDPRYAQQLEAVQADPTLLSSTLTTIAQENGLYGQEGWFIDENSPIGEAQRQETFKSWAIPFGPDKELTSWTLGRGITSGLMSPDQEGYNTLSGIIDAAASIGLDPLVYAGGVGLYSKSARLAGIVLDEGLDAIKVAKTAGRDLGAMERRLTFGREGRRVRAGVSVTNEASRKTMSEYNRLFPDKDPLTPQDWAGLRASEQIEIVKEVKKQQKVEVALKASKPDLDTLAARARDQRRSLANVARGGRAAEIAPVAGTVETLTRQVELWQDFSVNARLTQAKPVKGIAPVRAWETVDVPPVEVPAAVAPTEAAGDILPLSPNDQDLYDNFGGQPFPGATVPGFTSEEWAALPNDLATEIIGKYTGYLEGTWPPRATPGAAAAPAAPAPRELTVTEAGSGWDIVWDGQVIATSTTKRGAQAMRLRILKKDAEDAQMDAALASGRGAPAAPAEPVAPAAPTQVLKYGDATVTKGEGRSWVVEFPGQGPMTLGTKKAAQETAVGLQKAADDALPAAEKTVYSEAKYQKWWESLSEEDQALWTETLTYAQTKVMQKVGIDDIDYSSAKTVQETVDLIIKHLQGNVAKAQAKPRRKGKFESQAPAAAVRLIMNNEADVSTLAQVDTAGVTLVRPPEYGVFQRAVHDGADVITTWASKTPPVYKSADEVVDMKVATAVLAKTKEVIDANPLTVPAVNAGDDDLIAQVKGLIDDIHDPTRKVEGLLEVQGATYRALLTTYAQLGLDGYLDDFLRAEGIDGIEGVDAVERAGVWMGDHPMMESYAWPSDAVDNADVAGGILDEAEMATFLDNLPATAPRFGLHASSLDDISGWVGNAQSHAAKVNSERISEIGAAYSNTAAAQHLLTKELLTVEDDFADPVSALKSTLLHDAGASTDPARGVTMNPEGVRWFLFGTGLGATMRKRTFQHLSNLTTDAQKAKMQGLVKGTPEYDDMLEEIGAKTVGQLHQATGGKWDESTYRAVLENSLEGGGEEGLLRILAPRLGVDVTKGSIGMGLKVVDGDGTKMLRTWRTPSNAAARMIDRQMGLRPGVMSVALANSSEIADALVPYAVYTKMPLDEIQTMVGRVILNAGSLAATEKNLNVVKEAFNSFSRIMVDRVDEQKLLFGGLKGAARKKELVAAIQDSTRLFLGGSSGQRRDVGERIGNGVDYLTDSKGNRIELGNIGLESELLHGHVVLPDVDTWAAGISRIGLAIRRLPSTERAYDFVRQVYDNFFRTNLLVFRGSFVFRNSGEMQFRMFLNGHHSILSDPATMIGMVIGSKIPGGKLGGTFDRYGQTVLGSDFKPGKDMEEAVNQHMTEFYSLMKESHSLTDPRVYTSTIQRGWKKVEIDSPNFTAGWANEILSLHDSAIARAVLGVLPEGYRPNMRGVQSLETSVMDWIRSDDAAAAAARQRMIGANPQFDEVFKSDELLAQYLFESENSVLNRIKHFTMDDPVLMDAIRTGRFRGDGMDFSIRSGANLQERVNNTRAGIAARFYEKGVPKPEVRDHMTASRVMVPWIDAGDLKRHGSGLIDAFFRLENGFQRLTTIGPEARLAYWDRVAELAPTLRKSDVGTALDAARTTLGPIKRLRGESDLDDIGRNHPAFAALQKARSENSDGLLTLEEVHSIAMEYAMNEIKTLFYDAARRNNFWTSMRLIFPFGQAWGNTLTEWTKLGARKPIQVYKVQKVFNALTESGSAAVYEDTGSVFFNEYEDGYAPWEMTPDGGFFHSNQYGETVFMLPLGKYMSGGLAKALNAINGNDLPTTGGMDMSAGTQSLNLALGGEGILPGSSAFVPMGLDLLPDSFITDSLKEISAPYGQKDVIGNVLPSWALSTLGGVGAIPIIGDALTTPTAGLSAAVKNKNMRDATAVLTSTGAYDLTDPTSVAQLKVDAQNYATSFLLIEGAAKNLSPASPTLQYAIESQDGRLITLSMLGMIYREAYEDSGGDSVAAKGAIIKEFGPAFVFAVTGNKRGYVTIPSSEAMNWARSSPSNMEAARAYPEIFPLFFTQGDPTDLQARLWMEDVAGSAGQQFKNADEVVDSGLQSLIRVQNSQIDMMLKNGVITVADAAAAKDRVAEGYQFTDPGTTFNSLDTDAQLVKMKKFVMDNPSVGNSANGVSFKQAMAFRTEALGEARKRSGDPATTLKGKGVVKIKEALIADYDRILASNPGFAPLHQLLTKEWG
jgi:hypothetical protein